MCAACFVRRQALIGVFYVFSVGSLQGERQAESSGTAAAVSLLVYINVYAVGLGASYRKSTGTRGKNTCDSVSWTRTVRVPTIPGTRHRVPGSPSDGVQLYR